MEGKCAHHWFLPEGELLTGIRGCAPWKSVTYLESLLAGA